ncbi:MAG: DUF4236 domain-containing protein, partial [Rhodoferax sp.]|nr:DUF4236 domain-containing protein [Rhodoferax sp.]
MAFRFRKSIKILPGVRLNFSKSGVSTSIGVPGATVNVSDRGTRTTVGVPGTGISYTESHSMPKASPAASNSDTGTWFLWFLAAVAAVMVLYGI